MGDGWMRAVRRMDLQVLVAQLKPHLGRTRKHAAQGATPAHWAPSGRSAARVLFRTLCTHPLHLHRDSLGSPAATSAPGLHPRLPRMHRNCDRAPHICTRTGLAVNTWSPKSEERSTSRGTAACEVIRNRLSV